MTTIQHILYRQLKLIVPLITILMVLMTSAALMALASPRASYGFVVHSGDCGLVVNASDEFVDTGNLNPGDTKSSYLIAENTKAEKLRYFLDMVKTGSRAGFYPGLEGKYLDEILQFTIARNGQILFQGLISQFEEALDMGILAGNESQRIEFSVHLPGAETGNEFQAANVSVLFVFRTECEGKNGEATLEVRKFRDDNRDGKWDQGEPEIKNWKVFVNNVEYSTPLPALSLPAGTYVVREEMPGGWTASTPVEFSVTLDEGDHKVVWFGNYPTGGTGNGGNSGATLTVRKFHDYNGDGTWDGNEPEIEGWPVTINGNDYTTPVFLYNLSAGEYDIAEEMRDGWVATTETEVTVMLGEGQSRTVLFGNTWEREDENSSATLIVRKFHDYNGDGTWDKDEPEIMGWKVFVNGQAYQTPVNLKLDPGTYNVAEEIQPGWEPTTAAAVSVGLAEGESKTVLFGNEQEEGIIIIPPPTPDKEITVEPGDPLLPRTGELPPFYYYSAGLLLVLAGFLLGKKRSGSL